MGSLQTAQANPAPLHIDVSSYGVLIAEGSGADTFLQGQLTCDVNELHSENAEATGKNWLRGGYCDAKGKLWSTFYLTRDYQSDQNRYIFILPKATLPATLKEFQKFGVFHKVEFEDASDKLHVVAVAGQESAAAADSISHASISPMQLADNVALTVSETVPDNAHPETQWQLITIANVWPQLAESQVQQFIPQMLNLDLLNGINFKKGCYIGQETVARMHYKGQVKKRTFCVTGTATTLPKPGEQLEKQIGENWRRAGEILQAVWYDDGVVALLAVMSADTESETRLRIKGQDDSQFTLCPDS